MTESISGTGVALSLMREALTLLDGPDVAPIERYLYLAIEAAEKGLAQAIEAASMTGNGEES